MTDQIIEPSAADSSTATAVEAHLTGDTEKAAAAFDRASVERDRAARAEATGADDTWRDGQETLAPMRDAPPIAATEVDTAMAKLNAAGGEHAALVQAWGPDFGDNLSFAKEAFREIVANRPDIIAKVDASGLGNDPAVIELLARHGRLNAGLMGDHTISRRNTNVANSPMASNKPRASNAQDELHQIMSDHPPGSDSYKSPAVQRRVEALSKQIAGGGSAVGTGGRYA